jgi:RNA recognition motif-containing protein
MADNTRVFVGGIPYSASEDDLKAFFSAEGKFTVLSVFLPVEKDTGRKRGFGFVEFSTEAERDEAVTMFNGADMGGRKLSVSPARPRD